MSATAGANIAHLSRGINVDPDRTWAEYRAIIEAGIAGHERSQQRRIGPSGIGVECDACLAHMLAQTPENRAPASEWLPTIGTAVHAWLAEQFMGANAGLPVGAIRYLVEGTVSVGVIAGEDITGSSDLFDLWSGEVTDWKITGDNTINRVRADGHPGNQYRVQAHLYGRGWQRRGATVNRVRVAFLPRNHASLDRAHIWSEPYDEQIALVALERADRIGSDIREYGLDTVLNSLPPHSGGYSCRRYGAAPAAPATADAFLGLG